MSFIVIEGDNGTGKDTLAQALEKYGFNIITYDSKIKKFSQIAKKSKGKARVKKFLGYGKACSDLVKQNREKGKNSLLIRYWISTLAAAYADDIYSYDEVITIVKMISPKLEKPDKIIRLECDFDERIRRIEKRNSPDFDDKTLSRAKKYEWISKEIQSELNINWISIDTTNKTKAQVCDEAVKQLELENKMPEPDEK